MPTRRGTVLFDIDGTLIDAGGAGQAAMEDVFREEFRTLKEVTGIPTAGRTDRAITRDLFAFHGGECDPMSLMKLRDRYLAHLPKYLETHAGGLLPGTVEILSQLSHSGEWRLSLLTGNFEEAAWIKLRHYGIDHHFSDGGFGDEHVDRDDVARSIWSRLTGDEPQLEQLPVIVVGDTPADVKCGRAIGARVVAVATGVYGRHSLEAAKPDWLIDNLHNTRWLQELLA